MSATDKLIAEYIAESIRRRLEIDKNACFVAAAPDYDTAWQASFIIEVVPGAQQPYGDGTGAQDGGADLIEQPFVLWCFYRLKLDQYGKSTMLLIEDNKGILDRFKAIRDLFRLTMFPLVTSPTPTDFLLIEPVRITGESKTEWEDASLYLVRRSITLLCRYGDRLPDSGTLQPSDYT